MRKILHVITALALILVISVSMLFSSTENVMAAAKLKVSPKSKIMYIGDKITLKSNTKVKWTLIKGKGIIKLGTKKAKAVKVKALKAGTAYVKAKHGKSVKKIKITVRSRVPSSITLSVNRSVICIGETSVASVKSVKPKYASYDVKWYSSNKAIASVDKYGVITGKSPGRVTITAKSALSSKIKASITITVADVTRGTITATVNMTDPDKYPAGKVARVWIPIPVNSDSQKITKVRWNAPAAATADTTIDTAGNKALYVEWDSDAAPADRTVTLSFHVERREVVRPDKLASLEKGTVDKVKFADYLRQTNLSGSLDSGIVKETADSIVKSAGAVTVYDKAHAIYEWVVENLTRDASTPGLGKGDVEFILTHYDEGIGKCTDVNSVFDALCRAEGIPARGIFGMKFDTCGQKCKPQYYLPGYGWAEADPSEVLKIIMGHEDEYRGTGAPNAKEWTALKDKYWGRADANWFMFSEGRDITLNPPQTATSADEDGFLNDDGTLNYFVFPYAEYDGQYLMSHNRKKFTSYEYKFVEDEDCGC